MPLTHAEPSEKHHGNVDVSAKKEHKSESKLPKSIQSSFGAQIMRSVGGPALCNWAHGIYCFN